MTKEEIKSQFQEFDVLQIDELNDEIHITIKAKKSKAICPYCGYPSIKVHQKYTKVIQDLPINHKDVSLIIACHVFRCDNDDCDHFSFNEQFDIVQPLEKKSQRLIDYIIKLSRENTCRSVAKVLNDLGIKISKATVNNIYNKYR